MLNFVCIQIIATCVTIMYGCVYANNQTSEWVYKPTFLIKFYFILNTPKYVYANNFLLLSSHWCSSLWKVLIAASSKHLRGSYSPAIHSIRFPVHFSLSFSYTFFFFLTQSPKSRNRLKYVWIWLSALIGAKIIFARMKKRYENDFKIITLKSVKKKIEKIFERKNHSIWYALEWIMICAFLSLSLALSLSLSKEFFFCWILW